MRPVAEPHQDRVCGRVELLQGKLASVRHGGYVYISLPLSSLFSLYLCIYFYISLYIHIYICICIYTYMYIYIYIYICSSLSLSIHIYICRHIHICCVYVVWLCVVFRLRFRHAHILQICLFFAKSILCGSGMCLVYDYL